MSFSKKEHDRCPGNEEFFPSKGPWRSTCESPAAGWVSTHKCPDHHQSTVQDHSTGEVCRSIISWFSSLDFSFTSSRLSKKRNSLKINVLVFPSSHPRLVCSLELERKQSYFIIYCHLKFLIVVKVRCTALKGTSFHFPTVKLIAGTLRCVRFTCKHMDTLVFLRCILRHSKGWACQMNYGGSNCKLTQITHSYQKETFYFFPLKASRTKVGKASEIVPPKKETPAHALTSLCKQWVKRQLEEENILQG